MNKKAFDIALQEIEQLNLKVLESKYEPLVFGSWLISVKRKPDIRLVWDGKDYELSIQEKTKKKIRGFPIWEPIWSTLKPNDDDFGFCLTKFKSLAV